MVGPILSDAQERRQLDEIARPIPSGSENKRKDSILAVESNNAADRDEIDRDAGQRRGAKSMIGIEHRREHAAED